MEWQDEDGGRKICGRERWKQGVILVLHFINFTVISENIVESKAREGHMLTGDLLRLKRDNTERWRKSKVAG